MADAVGNKAAKDYHLDIPAPEQGFFAKGLGHTDFHIDIAEVAELGTGGGMRRAAGCDSDGRHGIRILLGDVRNFVKVLAFLGSSGADVVHRDRTGKAATVVAIGAGRIGDIFLGNDLADVEAGFADHLHDHVAAEHIAGMVEHEEQDAVALIGLLDGFKYDLGIGSRKNIADNMDIDHTITDKTMLCRLMTGTAEGNDGNAVCLIKGVADDHMAIYRNKICVGKRETFEELISQGSGIVDEFFHFHVNFLLLNEFMVSVKLQVLQRNTS